MHPVRPAAAAVILLTTALAGCLQAPSQPDASLAAAGLASPVAFEDPADDARELDGASVTRRIACGTVGCAAAPPLPSQPAPHFDVLSVALDGETADSILLSLTIQSLSEGFPEIAGPQGLHRSVEYLACWTADAEHEERCAKLEVHADGGAAASFTLPAEDCNEWWICAWEVPYTFEPGEPARIAFEVPKAYAAHDGAPLAVETLTASVVWHLYNPANPAWHAAYTLRLPDQHLHGHYGGWGEYRDVADSTDTFAVGAKLSDSWREPPAEQATILAPGPGAAHGAGSLFDRPYLDILQVDLAEADGHLEVAWTVAEFTETPRESFHVLLMLGVAGKEVWEVGYLREGVEGYGYAGHCISWECGGDFRRGEGDGHGDHDVAGFFATTVESEITPGAPGRIAIRIPLDTFPSLAPGDHLNFAYAVAMFSDANVYVGNYGDGLTGDVHKMSFIDSAWGTRPYVFRTGNEGAESGHEH